MFSEDVWDLSFLGLDFPTLTSEQVMELFGKGDRNFKHRDSVRTHLLSLFLDIYM